ncbi:MAG TPA: hypothetical protein VGK27_06650 [Candidatus Deferrimicrobiaceae bacterium]|jgi:hypothetical protein
MKKTLDEKGAVLILVLLLTVVALIAAAGLLYMVARGSAIFGQAKRYRTAVQAAKGGAEITFQWIGDRGTLTTPLDASWDQYNNPDLVNKLTTPTSAWPNSYDNSIVIDPARPATYDIAFTLGDYRVYSKIVDTVAGNSGPNTGLQNSGVVNTGSGEIVVVSMPFLYTIEELTQSKVNPSERVKYSILYQY